MTQTVDNCLLKDSIENKKLLISSLKKRILINCTIEKYQSKKIYKEKISIDWIFLDILDDVKILEKLDYIFDKEVLCAWM